MQSSNTSEKTTDRIHPTGSCDFVAFKKFTRAYWHQIALEIMFLPMLAFFSPRPFSPSVLSPRLVINTHRAEKTGIVGIDEMIWQFSYEFKTTNYLDTLINIFP